MQRVWSTYLDSFGTSSNSHKHSDDSHNVRNAVVPDRSTCTYEIFNLTLSHSHLFFFRPSSLDGSYVGACPINPHYSNTHPRAASIQDHPQWLLTPILHIHLQVLHVICLARWKDPSILQARPFLAVPATGAAALLSRAAATPRAL